MMKNLYIPALICLLLASCQKDKSTINQPAPPLLVSQSIVNAQDTIPDRAAIKLKLVKDSSNYDETMLCFNHAAPPIYNSKMDAVYFAGFGQEGLSSMSADGIELAINNQRYTPGMSVRLNIRAKSSGVYILKLSFQKDIPSGIHLWLKDNYRKDSLELSHYNYYFDIYKADSASFGKHRFCLVIRPGGA